MLRRGLGAATRPLAAAQRLTAARRLATAPDVAVAVSQAEGRIVSTLRRFGVQRVRPWLARALDGAGFVEPMPVQAAAMGRIAHHEDTVIHSETGSGKTLAFLVPLLSRLDPGVPLQLLILVPSRELALQVAFEAHRLLQQPEAGLHVALVVGGTEARHDALSGDADAGASSEMRGLQMQRELSREVAARRAEVVVATPSALARVLHTGPSAAADDDGDAASGRSVPGLRTLLRPQSMERATAAEDAPPPLGRAERALEIDRRVLASAGGGEGAKLMLTMGANLGAIVLDEVDLLLPKPLPKTLRRAGSGEAASRGYYRQKDWAKAGREWRREARPGGRESPPTARLVARILRAVAVANDSAADVRRARRAQWRARSRLAREAREPPPAPKKVQLVAASATVGRSVLHQLRHLFDLREPPAVVGCDGGVVEVPHGGRRKAALAALPADLPQPGGSEGGEGSSPAGEGAGTPPPTRPAVPQRPAAARGPAVTARGVAGVGVPQVIRHRYFAVGGDDEKPRAVADALGALRPRATLVILHDGARVTDWVDRLREAGVGARMLHEAYGFPTAGRHDAPRGGVATHQLLDAIGSFREALEKGAVDASRSSESGRGRGEGHAEAEADGTLLHAREGEGLAEDTAGASAAAAPPPPPSTVLVTTEASVRGIDLPHLDCVVLLFCPLTSDAYAHLAGRTARGKALSARGGEGVVLSILRESERGRLGLFTSQLGVGIKQLRVETG